ncbi:hypothetical protein XENTR_v10012241 [Xenopus tropicalis]|nr:hypothetical protein XENTR_v10012241 [Xenopus tropicalis]
MGSSSSRAVTSWTDRSSETDIRQRSNSSRVWEPDLTSRMCKGLAGVTAFPATCLKSAKDIKHRLGFLLQKADGCEHSPCVKKDKPGSQRLRQDEVKKWAESLENLINNECGLAAFRAFLQSEYSEENIDFWLACENYKKVKTPEKLLEKAQKIYEDFISVEATREVRSLYLFLTAKIIIAICILNSHSCFALENSKVTHLQGCCVIGLLFNCINTIC